MSACSPGFVAAAWIVTALSAAGVAHVRWLKSPASARFAAPLDGGMTVRGRRLFGDNKQLRGLLAMPPATAVAFMALAVLRDALPEASTCGLWNLEMVDSALLGFACGAAFMLAELPNSFVKRQLDVAPGTQAAHPLLRAACLVGDRVDSTLGALLALALLVPMTAAFAVSFVLLGFASHAAFSDWLFRARIKPRRL